ncbi:MAG: hypothetical protein ACLP9L_00980 [Thermoguttaceae bacterium]
MPFDESLERRMFPCDIHKDGTLVCHIMQDGWHIGTWIEAGYEGEGPVARKILAVNDLLCVLQRALDIRHPNVPWTKAETVRSWAAWEEDARAAIAKAKAG